MVSRTGSSDKSAFTVSIFCELSQRGILRASSGESARGEGDGRVRGRLTRRACVYTCKQHITHRSDVGTGVSNCKRLCDCKGAYFSG